MPFVDFQQLVQADLHRYDGGAGVAQFCRTFIREPRFRFTTLLRCCRYLRSSGWGRWGAYHFFKFWMSRLSLLLGVDIDPSTEIGPDFLSHLYIYRYASAFGELDKKPSKTKQLIYHLPI